MALDNLEVKLLDCTFRDGGYHNDWDFSQDLINEYLIAMKASQVNVVELGFRFLKNEGFKGGCAFTTDDFLRNLEIPPDLLVGVMVNAADLYSDVSWEDVMKQLFPESSDSSPVDLVRFACHFHELHNALAASNWLIERGYRVGLNLMQIADRTQEEVEKLGELASQTTLDVLYFADSMGSMTPHVVSRIVGWLRKYWNGSLGIHAHDNMRLALANTLQAVSEGVTWVDATITGMGRGPGNTRMEELVIEIEDMDSRTPNIMPLMSLIQSYFEPMKAKYKWGTNPFYYLAGKNGIHPTYIQEMLRDSRYGSEDILAVISHLSEEGGKRFSFNVLNGAKQFYQGEPRGTWSPENTMQGRDVLILGTGPSVEQNSMAIENYIRNASPIVLALNTQSSIQEDLIDLRIACHPVRLLADAEIHISLPQPLIAPSSMFPENLGKNLKGKKILDFGIGVNENVFEFNDTSCIIPSSLVLAYSLAVVTSGKTKHIFMAGFDGYPAGDLRNDETAHVLRVYENTVGEGKLTSVTPTVHGLNCVSIYGLLR